MITSLPLHLVQFSAIVPNSLKGTVDGSTIIDTPVDATHPIECHEAATKAYCLFWTSVLQRIAAAKSQDMPEAKGVIDNLVQDLLTILNLLDIQLLLLFLRFSVCCCFKNAGLKSKDTNARCLP